MKRATRSLLDEPTDGQRLAILLTTLMAGAIGACYMNLYWDHAALPTIALHMNPAHKPVLNWAPRWVPVTIMALLSMLFWRMFVARARGISIWAAVITLFVLFALRQGIEYICLDYSTALHSEQPPPLWNLVVMFPVVAVRAVLGAGIMLIIGFGDWIVMLVLACAAGVPTAFIGRFLWERLGPPVQENRRA